jgi:hypothetical protein
VVAGVGRDELVSRLVRIGEKEMIGEDEAEVDAYFAPDFRFHGPDGREWDYQGLKGYFGALQAPFGRAAASVTVPLPWIELRPYNGQRQPELHH